MWSFWEPGEAHSHSEQPIQELESWNEWDIQDRQGPILVRDDPGATTFVTPDQVPETRNRGQLPLLDVVTRRVTSGLQDKRLVEDLPLDGERKKNW